jgi:hypothetical protein
MKIGRPALCGPAFFGGAQRENPERDAAFQRGFTFSEKIEAICRGENSITAPKALLFAVVPPRCLGPQEKFPSFFLPQRQGNVVR